MATKYSEQVQSMLGSSIPYARKNLIINGAFDIWQRTAGVSQTGIGPSTTIFGPDRFALSVGAATAGVASITRATSSPSNIFTPYAFRINCTTADASTSSGEQVTLRYRIEGVDIRHIMGKVCTLSFWVRAYQTGTFCIAMNNSGADRNYVATYTINQSDTWEYKTITFTMHDGLSGTWTYAPDTTGLNIRWTLLCGTDFQTSNPNIWESSSAKYATSSQVNFFSSTNNNFFLKNIQFELGPVATDFESRLYQTELALCQRYYEKSYALETAPGSISSAGSVIGIRGNGAGVGYLAYKVQKPNTAVLTIYSTATGASGNVRNLNTGTDQAATTGSSSEYGFNAYSATASISDVFAFQWTANAEI
jgi:hypothetical protein